MINFYLFFLQIIFIKSLDKFNISYIKQFLNKLSNFSINISELDKISEIIKPKNYCMNYSINLSACLECEKGYTLLNGECVCYDRNCKKCKSSLYGACIECYPGYALSADNTCRCNIPHCLLCDDDICNVCEKGYSLSESKTSCDFNLTFKNYGYCNDTNCDICTTNIDGSCIKCKDGFNLENGTCIINPSLRKYFKGNVLCPEDYISACKGCNKFCLGEKCDDINPNYMLCQNKCTYCKNGILYEYINCNMNEYCYDQKCIKCRTN